MSLTYDFGEELQRISATIMRQQEARMFGYSGLGLNGLDIALDALETDDDLRARICYVADETREIHEAAGQHLDDIAARYGLKRRRRT